MVKASWWDQSARFCLAAFAVSLPLSISGAQIALGALLGLTVGARLGASRALPRSPLGVPLLVFLGALLLSTLAGGLSWHVLDGYRELWVIGVYFATLAWAGNATHAGKLARTLVVVASGVAVYGIVQHFTGIDAYRALVGRRTLVRPYEYDPSRFTVIGFFPSYLTYAHSLIFPLAWAVAAAVGPGGWILGRLPAACCALLLGAALVLSTARGAWLAAGVVVIAACGLAGIRRSCVALGTALVLVVVAFSVTPGLRAEARSMIDMEANAGRMAIYAANLEMVRDHPLLGVGFGGYDRRAGPYYDRHPRADRRSHAHNVFLQVAAEAGMVGLVTFCYVFAVILVRGWRLVGRLARGPRVLWVTAAGAWLGVVGFLVGGLTQNTFADSECAMPMWFAVAVLMTVDREVVEGGAAARASR